MNATNRHDCCLRRVAAATVAFGVLFLAGSAGADWAEGFDAGFVQSWTFDSVDDIGNPPSTGISTFEIVEAGVDD